MAKTIGEDFCRPASAGPRSTSRLPFPLQPVKISRYLQERWESVLPQLTGRLSVRQPLKLVASCRMSPSRLSRTTFDSSSPWHAPHNVRMELARDQFVEAVSSVRLQQRLKEDPPASLDAAVCRAVQLEAVWGTAAATPVPSSVPQGANVLAVRDRASDAHLDLVAAMGNLGLVAERLSHVADRLARTVDSWEDGTPNRHDRAVRAGPRGSPRSYRMITCWQCGQPGHVRTNCPNFRGNGMPGNGR